MAGIKIFFSYAHEDEKLRDELAKHLMVLVRYNVIELWHDRKLQPGDEWSNKINDQLLQAQIILLLISPDFFASPYCCENEMQIALARHNKGEAVVIPVILRSCDWDITELKKLQAVPKDAKPVCLWDNFDEAFADIVRKIREYAENLNSGSLVYSDSLLPTPVIKNLLPSYVPQNITVLNTTKPVVRYNIIFVDIQGFTNWLTHNVSTPNAAKTLVSVLYWSIEKVFGRFTPLGESALIVVPSNAENRIGLNLEFEELINKILDLDDMFEKHKEESVFECNCDELRLGFGVTSDSQVLEIQNRNDVPSYIGVRIALAKRLCSIALPYGIVIHKDSFRDIPNKYALSFSLQKTIQLRGSEEENEVWVSSSVCSVENAEVHVSGLLVRDGRVLLLKRAGPDKTKIYPNHWAGPGGRVRFTMTFEDSLKFIFKDEVGIHIANLKFIDTYFNKEHYIPGLLYQCTVDSGGINESDTLSFFGKADIDDLSLLIIPDLRKTIFDILGGKSS